MNGENKETSIKELIQGMIPREVDLMQGTVISTSPLRIKMINDSKLIISRISTVVPRHLTDHKVSVTTADGDSAEMTVHNALNTGDKVHLLAIQNGKKYFVLDRV